MTCPPACTDSGVCVRACVPPAGPSCGPCEEGHCWDCRGEAEDAETGEWTPCFCPCGGEGE